jgi:hypothetical protein
MATTSFLGRWNEGKKRNPPTFISYALLTTLCLLELIAHPGIRVHRHPFQELFRKRSISYRSLSSSLGLSVSCGYKYSREEVARDFLFQLNFLISRVSLFVCFVVFFFFFLVSLSIYACTIRANHYQVSSTRAG